MSYVRLLGCETGRRSTRSTESVVGRTVDMTLAEHSSRYCLTVSFVRECSTAVHGLFALRRRAFSGLRQFNSCTRTSVGPVVTLHVEVLTWRRRQNLFAFQSCVGSECLPRAALLYSRGRNTTIMCYSVFNTAYIRRSSRLQTREKRSRLEEVTFCGTIATKELEKKFFTNSTHMPCLVPVGTMRA